MNNIKEVFICGTRPDIIKMAPLINKLKPFVINTGQHKELAKDAFNIFNITPDINLKLMKKNQKITTFISKCIIELNKIILKQNPKRIWVQGDTMSAYAGALVASLNNIQLIHVEAGLRSNDKQNPFPEESLRIMIDRLADIKFAPTNLNVINLKTENIYDNIYKVGNTIVDSLNEIKKILPNKRPIEEKYVLATVHRRESFGDEMEQIFQALKELSLETRVILPAHPNPNVQKLIKKVGLKTVKPMNYRDFLWYLRDCEYVISDSGGIQEEAPSFKKKIIVLRKTTERQELIEAGYGVLIKKLEKNYILDKINKYLDKKIIFGKNPFGDGKTTERIYKLLKKYDFDKHGKNNK